MKLVLAAGAALAALTVAASAETTSERHFVFVRASSGGGDANHDGWLSRAEATAQAEATFAQFDGNHDGKLDDADAGAAAGGHEVNVETQGENIVIRRAGQEDIVVPRGEGRRVIRINGDHVEESGGDAGGDAQIIVRELENTVTTSGDGHEIRIVRRGGGDEGVQVLRSGEAPSAPGGDGARTVERHVIVMRHGDGENATFEGGAPPMPPIPPMAPMMMFSSGSLEEFDRNHDGALSLDEFRTQQLRQFDAADGNRDGRVRVMTPPEPPAPPAAPQPPTPPR